MCLATFWKSGKPPRRAAAPRPTLVPARHAHGRCAAHGRTAGRSTEEELCAISGELSVEHGWGDRGWHKGMFIGNIIQFLDGTSSNNSGQWKYRWVVWPNYWGQWNLMIDPDRFMLILLGSVWPTFFQWERQGSKLLYKPWILGWVS